MEWDEAAKHLKNTEKLSEVDIENYDVLFLPGGHGPMFDLATDETLCEVVEYFCEHDKIIAALCHGPAGLLSAKKPDGRPFVEGKTLTSFTNKEEDIVKMSEFMPFSLEDTLIKLGADFISDKPWAEHVEIDGNLITGQNQNCAVSVAQEVINLLNKNI